MQADTGFVEDVGHTDESEAELRREAHALGFAAGERTALAVEGEVVQAGVVEECETLLEATAGRGVDAAIEIAGVDDAIETAIALARPAATVVVAGIPAGDHSTIAASIARRKGLDLRFSRRMNRVYPRAIALVEAGLVDVSSLVSHRFAIDGHEEAFRIAAQKVLAQVAVLVATTDVALKIYGRAAAPTLPPRWRWPMRRR